jgi:hypothetical protein
MNDQLLTPNTQLAVFLTGFVAITLFIGVVYALLRNYLASIDKKIGLPAIPLWRHVVAEATAVLTHDWGEDLDVLMHQANQWPEVPMTPEQIERFDALLLERENSERTDLRPGERELARLYRDALALMRIERANIEATQNEPVMVTSPVPEDQTSKDKSQAEDNPGGG